MGWVIWVLLALIIIIGIIVTILYLPRSKEEEDLPINTPQITNYLHRFTEGYHRGIFVNEYPNQDGRTIIEFAPTDCLYNRNQVKGKEDINPPRQYVIVGKGAMSVNSDISRRTQIYLLPKYKHELEGNSDPLLLEFFSEQIEKNLFNDFVIEGTLNDMEKTKKLFKDNFGGELSKEELQRMSNYSGDMLKKAIEIIMKGKKKGKDKED